MYFGNVEITKHENGRVSFTVRSDVSPSDYLHNVVESVAHHFIANLRDLGHLTDAQQAEAETFIHVHNISAKELVSMELRRLTVLANLMAADFNNNDDAFERTAVMCGDIGDGFEDLVEVIRDAKPATEAAAPKPKKYRLPGKPKPDEFEGKTAPKPPEEDAPDAFRHELDCPCADCEAARLERETTFTAGRRG